VSLCASPPSLLLSRPTCWLCSARSSVLMAVPTALHRDRLKLALMSSACGKDVGHPVDV
jgi:hypothetical protein